MTMRRFLVLALLLVGPCEAYAGKNCTCRANGQSFHEGTIMCIRGKLSRCEMNQNVTSWKVIAETCPEASGQQQTRIAMLPSPIANSVNH